MRSLLSSRGGSQLIGSSGLFALLVLGGLLYASGGGPARDILVTQMLINAVMVIGLQIYIGNTGVLSFGHMGFAAISGYAFALLATTVKRKERIVPDVPLGLDDVSLNPLVAAAVAVLVTAAVGLVVGLGLARSGAKSGAVAATVITLALLFMVHEVGGAYADLTGGRNGISFSVGRGLDGRLWVYLALIAAIVVARFFKSSRIGRMAQAAREDDLAARAMGINPARGQMAALILSVAVVSVAASLRVFQLGTVAPSTFFFDYTLLTLVMLIVGGRNSIAGSVLGVALMTVVNETTRHLADTEIDGGPLDVLDIVLRPGLTDIVLGSSMLGFMIFRARGLIEDWEIDHWLRRRFGRAEDAPTPLRAAATPEPAKLTAAGVTVDFGGFRALEDAGLEASNREVVGLIGPNGAGKTTLLNVVTGLVEATEGTATLTQRTSAGPFDTVPVAGAEPETRPVAGAEPETRPVAGAEPETRPVAGAEPETRPVAGAEPETRPVAGAEPYEIARAGLARTFQNLRLLPALTVRENVDIAALVALRHRPADDRPSVEQLLVHAGLWHLRDRRARELDYGNARRLELVRAAALSPVFILLDEPTSGMSDVESVAMIDEVRALAAAVGAGVVVIDHDLAFITGVCDRIYCLDQGRVIAVGTPAEIQADPQVQAAYLGATAPAATA